MTQFDPLFLHPLSASKIDQHLFQGQYIDALIEIFAGCPSAFNILDLDMDPTNAQVKNALTKSASLIRQNPNTAVCATSALLLLFGQLNQVGPIAIQVEAKLPSVLYLTDPNLIQATLAVDGEDVYHLSQMPMLVALALSISMNNVSNSADDKESAQLAWWHARAQRYHQTLLDNPAESIRLAALSSIDQAQSWAFSFGEQSDVRALWHLERALILQMFMNDIGGCKELECAALASQFTFRVSGLMGRRTKFQQNATSQLVVLAQSRGKAADDAFQNENVTAQITDLALNDDTLLEKPSLEGGSSQATDNLGVIDQCILLAYLQFIKNTNPSDELTIEQMRPFVRRVVEHPNNWTVHTIALLFRSRIEANKSRTVERAVLQLQALVDQISGPVQINDAPVNTRTLWLYAVSCPTRWAMESELAEAMLALGLVRSALDIYTRLELWEKTVLCHMLAQQPKQAETLVLQLLSKKPRSPKYLCMMGDIRGDISFYTEAWEQSGKRHARAMRSLGHHYYKNKNYAESVKCYQRALEINPLFENSWFILGCAALQTSNWAVAQSAFVRCTAMDHTNAEAWNNLATVYIKQGKKPEAFQALNQGLKAKYDSWKMWTNYLYLAIDLGKLDEGMHAMCRVIEIRSHHSDPKVQSEAVDIEILQMLVRSVMEIHLDHPINDRVARLDSLISICTSTPAPPSRQVWLVAANFQMLRGCPRAALDAHIRAYRCVSRDTYVTDCDAECAVNGLQVLVEAYRDLGDRVAEANAWIGNEKLNDGALACADWKYQCKLAARALLGRMGEFEESIAYKKMVNLMAEVNDL